MPSVRGCFVTGTDTEVGKTLVATGILHGLAALGRRTAGFKPIAAGSARVGGRCVNGDARALRRASSLTLTDAEVAPYCFEAACAPHIAAALEGRSVEIGAIVESARALSRRCDCLVVEGVGGFLVPIDDEHTAADIALTLGLPVVLVIGLRLGCLNQALLTAEAVRARGLRLAGWVVNRVDPGMPYAQANVHTLRRRLAGGFRAACLGDVPWLYDPHPAAVSAHLDLRCLLAAIDFTRPARPER